MSFERRDSPQVCTWDPPLPQRAFPVLQAGSTTELPAGFGIGPDGTRYGWYLLNTSAWAVIQGAHMPPVVAGEKFQLWTVNTGSGYHSFPSPPSFADGTVMPGSGPDAISSYAPDLFNVYGFTISREFPSKPAPYALKDATVCTVVGVQQASSNSWNVYFSPQLNQNFTPTPGADGIVTIPMLRNPKWLGQIGHVANVDYTYSLPGGPEQLTCILQVEPNFRDSAMNPGRIVTVHKGGSCIWEGTLTEPQPASTGWTITANGVGTYGANFGAWWQMPTSTTNSAGATITKAPGWNPDGPVDLAISRGLRWLNRGIGNPAGIYTGPIQNAGSITLTDFMNLLTTGGSLIWELQQPASASSFPPGPWELRVYTLPQDFSGDPLQAGAPQRVSTEVLQGGKWKRVDRIVAEPRTPPQLHIVNVNPIARTLTADINSVILYYQITADTTATSTVKSKAATYGTVMVDNPGSVAIHGRMEYYLDISNAGVFTAANAAAVGRNVLNKYLRANFSSAFSVQPGQLLNDGGVPVDLGVNWGGYTCDVQGINFAAGGEVGLAPITFVIGQYEFNDQTQTATITPFQSARADISSIVNMLYPGKFA